MKAPQGVTGEVGDEGAEEKHGKKKEIPGGKIFGLSFSADFPEFLVKRHAW